MVKNRIIHQYVFRELLGPFGLGLLVFTCILLMNKVLKLMDLVVNKGVGLGEVGALIAYLIPSFLVLTIPMSVLLAILIALGRFSADSEIVAMKSSGISLYQLIPPFALFCAIGFLMTNSLTLFLLPKGNFAFKQQLARFASTHAMAGIEAGVFKDAFENVVLYVNDYDRKQNLIKGIFISDRRDPKHPAEISGKQARFLQGADGSTVILRIFNGSLHNYDKSSGDYQYLIFNTYEMNINLGGGEAERRIRYREMGLLDLLEKTKAETVSPRIWVEIQQRFAFPFACLVFGLLGLPLGVYWRRGGKAYGFVLSILIVFCYYILLSFGENLAKNAYVSAFIGIWLPNVIYGILGVILFRKAAREEPFFMQREIQNRLLDFWAWVKYKLQKKRKKLKEPEPLFPAGIRNARQELLPLAGIESARDKDPDRKETGFRGNTVSGSFHKPGCKHYKARNSTRLFASREDALRAGYSPCRKCNP